MIHTDTDSINDIFDKGALRDGVHLWQEIE